MEIQQIKLLVENGAISGATIRQHQGTWVIEFERFGKAPEPLERQRVHEVRLFKTLDGAAAQLEKVGIKNAIIKMH